MCHRSTYPSDSSTCGQAPFTNVSFLLVSYMQHMGNCMFTWSTHEYTHDQCFAFMTTQTVNELRNHNYIATFLPDGTFPVLPSCMSEPSLRCILPSALMPIFLFLGFLSLKEIDGEDRKSIVQNNKITEIHRLCYIYTFLLSGVQNGKMNHKTQHYFLH